MDPPFAGMTSAKGEKPSAPPFDPSERKRYQPDEPSRGEAEPGLPEDADAVAIAAAQKQAAELGVPFCEECVRQQLQGGRA